MILLPDGFNAAALFADFFRLAAPFVCVAFLIACGMVINNIFKNAPK